MKKITFKTSINEVEGSQIIYADKNYVLIKQGDKETFYKSENKQNYFIDRKKRTLTAINYSKLRSNSENIKKLFGCVEEVGKRNNIEYLNFPACEFLFNSNKPPYTINCKIITISTSSFLGAYLEYYQFENNNQIISIPLDNNEIIAYNKTEIYSPQGKHLQELQLISIDDFDYQVEIKELDSYVILN